MVTYLHFHRYSLKRFRVRSKRAAFNRFAKVYDNETALAATSSKWWINLVQSCSKHAQALSEICIYHQTVTLVTYCVVLLGFDSIGFYCGVQCYEEEEELLPLHHGSSSVSSRYLRSTRRKLHRATGGRQPRSSPHRNRSVIPTPCPHTHTPGQLLFRGTLGFWISS